MTTPSITPDQTAALEELMQDCAQAQFDDGEFNVDGNGVSGYGAHSVLQKVADILGIEGPRGRLDRLYEEADA